MEMESESLPPSPSQNRPGLGSGRTQKKLMLRKVFETIKQEKQIKLKELIAKMSIDEGFSKRTAKEYLEVLYNADYITIEGEDLIVKIKKDLK